MIITTETYSLQLVNVPKLRTMLKKLKKIQFFQHLQRTVWSVTWHRGRGWVVAISPNIWIFFFEVLHPWIFIRLFSSGKIYRFHAALFSDANYLTVTSNLKFRINLERAYCKIENVFFLLITQYRTKELVQCYTQCWI